MATLTVQTIAPAGTVPSYAAAAAGGDKFFNDGATFLQVKNSNGSTRDVTITPVKTTTTKAGFGTIVVDPIVVTVAITTGDVMIGPLPQAFNDGDGNVNVTYSAVTGVTVAAIKLPRAV